MIALKGDESLSGKITYNSNNQNAIKARDLRSNHPIQVRLQKEIQDINYKKYRFEVKRGEKTPGHRVISNEDAGLVLLALDLGEPWSCHQRYRIMDDSHSRIFGRPIVDGYRILVMHELFNSSSTCLANIDDRNFAGYNLTKYFLAFAVSEIIKSNKKGKGIWRDFKSLFIQGNLDNFVTIFSSISETTALDLNANVEELNDVGDFDYKAELKSANWCRSQARQLVASYQKDVKRKKADSLDKLLKDF